jgi:hypothetical protein
MLTCPSNCYKSLFDGCTSLVSGPEVLPATTLGGTCYRNMFFNCSSLVNAPYIAAESRADGCFQRMFVGCSSLRLIKLNCKTYKAIDFQKGGEAIWYSGVPSDGEIWLNPALKGNSGLSNIVPHGNNWQWTVKTLPDGELWNNN